MSNLSQIWVFVGLAGFIFVSSCLFFAVVSQVQTYSLIPEEKNGQTMMMETENRE